VAHSTRRLCSNIILRKLNGTACSPEQETSLSHHIRPDSPTADSRQHTPLSDHRRATGIISPLWVIGGNVQWLAKGSHSPHKSTFANSVLQLQLVQGTPYQELQTKTPSKMECEPTGEPSLIREYSNNYDIQLSMAHSPPSSVARLIRPSSIRTPPRPLSSRQSLV
jgi:hypothetical protein